MSKTTTKQQLKSKQVECPEAVLALRSMIEKVAGDARKQLDYTPDEPIEVDATVRIVGSITIGAETEYTPPLPDVEGLVALLIRRLIHEGHDSVPVLMAAIAVRTPVSSGEWDVTLEERAYAAELIRKIKNRLTPQPRSGAVRCQCEMTIEHG